MSFDEAAYQREYRQKNADHLKVKAKDYYRANRERITADRLQRRRLLDILKANRSCTDCGGHFPPECMDFDHVRGEKRFQISGLNYSTDAIVAEMDKCELVCANCHRIRTRKRRGEPK